VFGDPVEHSLSPAMHNAAYAALGMERAYVAFHVTPEHLASAIRAIPALGILGVNLTVPHKQRAVRMMSELSSEARLLGAINCVINRGGTLRGDNTDARGLETDLRELRVDLRGKTALVIGAGGAAVSALLACARLGARRIVVSNRTLAHARSLVRRFSVFGHGGAAHLGRSRTFDACVLDALMDTDLLARAALVINATPMGLKTGRFAPLAYKAASHDCVFYDLVYAKQATPFLRPALDLGRRAVDGAGMLASQGELAFRLFNGVAPPKGAMHHALMRELGRSPEM
jgi:shikimate dehydrogenase